MPDCDQVNKEISTISLSQAKTGREYRIEALSAPFSADQFLRTEGILPGRICRVEAYGKEEPDPFFTGKQQYPYHLIIRRLYPGQSDPGITTHLIFQLEEKQMLASFLLALREGIEAAVNHRNHPRCASENE